MMGWPITRGARSCSLSRRSAVVSRLPSGPGTTFLDTTDSGCLVCTLTQDGAAGWAGPGLVVRATIPDTAYGG